MGKMTGYEKEHELPPKVRQLYNAVLELISQGVDVNTIKVSDITQKAGIGKGTAYDYFDTKEDIIICALIHAVAGMIARIKVELSLYHTFQEQVEKLFDAVEKEMLERECFMRFVHMMTDSSFCGKALQQRTSLDEHKECDAMRMLAEMVVAGQKRGEVVEHLPVDYIIYSLMSKLLMYLAVCNEQAGKESKAKCLKPYILEGLFAEFCR